MDIYPNLIPLHLVLKPSMHKPWSVGVLCFIGYFLIFGCSTTPNQTHNSDPHLAAIVDSTIDALGVSGAVLSVAKHGELVHESSHGFAQQYTYGGDEMPAPVEMQAHHIFDLASLTKVFATTFGIMLLVDDGAISLDEPVSSYLPAFSGEHKDSITVRHLLSHTSGLHPWKPIYYHASDAEEALQYIANLPLAAPVGRSRRYSDLGFMLLGYLIEEVSNQNLNTFLQTRLYKPLGLKVTGFSPKVSTPSDYAATSHGNPFEKRMVADDDFGYVCDENPEAFSDWRARVLIGEVNDGNAFHAHEGLAGHAGLFSTAAELQHLLELLLNNGMHNGNPILSSSTIRQFLTPDAWGNGLGWAMAPSILMTNDLPVGSFGHTGFTGTYALAVPDHGISIILLTNRQHAGVGPDGRYPAMNDLRRSVVAFVLANYTATN